MHMINLKCPNCGAPLDIDKDRDNVYCEYCGSLVYSKIDSRTVEETIIRDEARLKEIELERYKYEERKREQAKALQQSRTLLISGLILFFLTFFLIAIVPSDNPIQKLLVVLWLVGCVLLYLSRKIRKKSKDE